MTSPSAPLCLSHAMFKIRRKNSLLPHFSGTYFMDGFLCDKITKQIKITYPVTVVGDYT